MDGGRQKTNSAEEGVLAVVCLVLLLGHSIPPAFSEVYVAGQAGASFPVDLRNVEGTGSMQGMTAGPLDLKNSGLYGGKIGYFLDDPGRRWLGVEVEFFTTEPSASPRTDAPPGSFGAIFTGGAHVHTYIAAANVMARHQWRNVQPYIGLGLAWVTATVSTDRFSTQDSSPGLNLLAGVRAFVSKEVAIFVEGKYTYTSFQFEDSGLSGVGIKGIYAAPAVVGGLAWHFR